MTKQLTATFFGLIATALVAVSVAQPAPAAPIITAASTFAAPAPGGGGAQGWPDFATVYGVPWTPVLPNPPTTTSTVDVDNQGELDAVENTDNVRINIRAGTYTGGLNLTGNDQHVVIQSNVHITGFLSLSGTDDSLIEFEICRDPLSDIDVINIAGASNQYQGDVTDLDLNCIRVTNEANLPTSTGIFFECGNCGIRNSEISSNTYGMFADAGAVRPTNVTFWNNIIESHGQSLSRFTGLERVIYCDNRFVKHQGGQLIRDYSNGADAWVCNNQIEAENGEANFGNVINFDETTNGTPIETTHGYNFVDNVLYMDSSDDPIRLQYVNGSGMALVSGNVEYGSGDAWAASVTGMTNDGTNVNNADGTAPTWVFYEDR